MDAEIANLHRTSTSDGQDVNARFRELLERRRAHGGKVFKQTVTALIYQDEDGTIRAAVLAEETFKGKPATQLDELVMKAPHNAVVTHTKMEVFLGDKAPPLDLKDFDPRHELRIGVTAARPCERCGCLIEDSIREGLGWSSPESEEVKRDGSQDIPRPAEAEPDQRP